MTTTTGQSATTDRDPPEDLRDLLSRVERAGDGGDTAQVHLRDVVGELGQASFAPFILLPGLILLVPGIGDLPGVPVTMGALVVLSASQLLVHRHDLWLPDWLGRRSIERRKLKKSLSWMRPVAKLLDRVTRPRLTGIVRGAGVGLMLISCILIATATPVMEIVPLLANIAGAALVGFGLALFARDGVLALLAFALLGACVAWLLWLF